MLAGPKGTEDPRAWASSPEWHAFRDAFYALLLDARSPRASPDADRRLVAALSALAPAHDGEDALLAAVFEAGSEVGRHVVSKSIVEDSRAEALDAIGRSIERAGAASVVASGAFHRTFTLTVSPGPAAAREDVLASFVSGLLSGSLGESLNCRVAVERVQRWTFEARLGEGRGRGVTP